MTSDEYIAERLDDQISWYDQKSQNAQRRFRVLRRTEILCAAIIPFLAGFSSSHALVPIAVGALGVVVVVLAAFQSLGQHQENWIEYRTTCESLRHEKYLFVTGTVPYDVEKPFPLLVERVEHLISKENSAWSQQARDAADRSKVDGGASPPDA